MADDHVATEKVLHRGHRDQIAALFQARPFEVVSHEELEAVCGRNWQQRLSDARRQLKMNIENIPRHDANGKRLTGSYRYRPDALGREADTVVTEADSHVGPLFDRPGAYNR